MEVTSDELSERKKRFSDGCGDQEEMRNWALAPREEK